MDRLELTKRLAQAGVSDGALSFLPTNGKYCLLQHDSKWMVYFVERGIETYRREFGTEEEACAHLFELLTRSHLAR